MFTRVQALRFRCLRHVDQELTRFMTLAGPNASGKSTFLDVLGLLGDVARHGSGIRESLRERSPDFRRLLWMEQGSSFQLAVEARLPDSIRGRLREELRDSTTARYEVEIGLDADSNDLGLRDEVLWLCDGATDPARREVSSFPAPTSPPDTLMLRPKPGRTQLISNRPGQNADFHVDGDGSYRPSFRLDRDTTALANVPADRDSFIAGPWLRNLLDEGVQTLVLNAEHIRRPSPPGSGRGFQPDGSNLPWVVAELKKDTTRFHAWLDHLRTALPDLVDLTTVVREEDRHRYLILEYDTGAKVPSWLCSDGTLRLLALTIPAYLEGFNGVVLVEEPENGIHPGAVETVVQSLESIYDGQVLMASHSPVALNLVEPERVLCFAKDDEGATDVVRGDRHPALRSWREGAPDFGVLFASGILS